MSKADTYSRLKSKKIFNDIVGAGAIKGHQLHTFSHSSTEITSVCLKNNINWSFLGQIEVQPL